MTVLTRVLGDIMACEDQISSTDLENAKLDAITLAEVATSRLGGVVGGAIIDTSTTRLGNVSRTVEGALSEIVVGDVTAYSAATTYTLITEWVTEAGAMYRPLPSALPIGPEAFNAANWSPVNGLNLANISGNQNTVARADMNAFLDSKTQPTYAAIRTALTSGDYVALDSIQLTGSGIDGYGIVEAIGTHTDNGNDVITGGSFAWIRKTLSVTGDGLSTALGSPVGVEFNNGRWEISAAVTITSVDDIHIDGRGLVIYDNGVEDDDFGASGTLRRFLGITFTTCKNVTIKNLIMQSNTNDSGNGIIQTSVNYSNLFRFDQCTTVTLENVVWDFRNKNPDGSYRSEAGSVNDLLRSSPVYFDNSNNCKVINCGIANTNDTGETLGFRNCEGVVITGHYSMKGIGAGRNHSALAKIISCTNVDVSNIEHHSDYLGTLFDVSGQKIRFHNIHVDSPQGGLVDLTREYGPSGGSVSDVLIENCSTTGKNLISTAPVTGVLIANTGGSYDSTDSPISKVRIINCSTSDDTSPFNDNESGVSHAIDMTDVFDGLYIEGYEKNIKNPEGLVQRLTTADTTLDYKFTVVGYTYYQDEVAQDWVAECTVGGIGKFIDCNFEFSPTVATTNKSLLTLNDLRLINGDAGITPSNTTAKLIFENCKFTNVAFTVKCNVDFVACHFENCIMVDSGIANFVKFDKDCTVNLIDTSTSLVATDAGALASFIYFQTINVWEFHGKVTGEYVRPTTPSDYGLMGTIASSGVVQNFKGAEFNVEARASTGGAATEGFCIYHWDRNDNATYIKDVNVDPTKNLMVIVDATAAAASTSARLDVIGCDTRGKLVSDGGTFTNSTLMMVNNTCNTTNQTGTWTTTILTPNTTGLT